MNGLAQKPTPAADRSRMRLGARILVLLAGVALLASCGGSSTTKASSDDAPTRTDRPSAAAKMVCAAEAQDDIAKALRTKTTRPVTATWARSTYSCPYSYAGGTMAVSVKQLSGGTATEAYFLKLARDLGRRPDVFLSFGDESFLTNNGSVVVRKDHMVLLVDVKGLPERFGHPVAPRSSTAETVARTIMGCWVGAGHDA